jgi:hypothetical protein
MDLIALFAQELAKALTRDLLIFSYKDSSGHL